MSDVLQNDFIMEILQDIIEIQSMAKIIKDSATNENSDISMQDIGNIFEIFIAKISNTRISLDKYINTSYK